MAEFMVPGTPPATKAAWSPKSTTAAVCLWQKRGRPFDSTKWGLPWERCRFPVLAAHALAQREVWILGRRGGGRKLPCDEAVA